MDTLTHRLMTREAVGRGVLLHLAVRTYESANLFTFHAICTAFPPPVVQAELPVLMPSTTVASNTREGLIHFGWLHDLTVPALVILDTLIHLRWWINIRQVDIALRQLCRDTLTLETDLYQPS